VVAPGGSRGKQRVEPPGAFRGESRRQGDLSKINYETHQLKLVDFSKNFDSPEKKEVQALGAECGGERTRPRVLV